MARKLDPKAIKERIKTNKAIIKDAKRYVTESMLCAMRGQAFDPKESRRQLSDLIKAADAVMVDEFKLRSLEQA